MTDEQKMEEGRRMFQVFAARLFEQRVLNAYREKIAQERQEKLLQEIEDEEKEKQERLQRRSREKEKKKDKKRAARQQKDVELKEKEAREKEEVLKKEAEEREKHEQLRRQREDEKKRKEEERKRKEAEKVRRSEEKRRRQQLEREKEEQRKQAAEVRARKEKEHQEAKARHEEDRRRQALKAQHERLERLERERQQEAEAKLTVEAEAISPSLSGDSYLKLSPDNAFTPTLPATPELARSTMPPMSVPVATVSDSRALSPHEMPYHLTSNTSPRAYQQSFEHASFSGAMSTLPSPYLTQQTLATPTAPFGEFTQPTSAPKPLHMYDAFSGMPKDPFVVDTAFRQYAPDPLGFGALPSLTKRHVSETIGLPAPRVFKASTETSSTWQPSKSMASAEDDVPLWDPHFLDSELEASNRTNALYAGDSLWHPVQAPLPPPPAASYPIYRPPAKSNLVDAARIAYFALELEHMSIHPNRVMYHYQPVALILHQIGKEYPTLSLTIMDFLSQLKSMCDSTGGWFHLQHDMYQQGVLAKYIKANAAPNAQGMGMSPHALHRPVDALGSLW